MITFANSLALASADPEGGGDRGSGPPPPPPPPPGKSQVMWVSIGNPPGKSWAPSWKMLDPLWNLEK